MSDIAIRHAKAADLSPLLDIYNFYVLNTPITFDIEPRTLAQRQDWLEQFTGAGRHQCFVALNGRTPVGWACSAKFKEKAAYQTSVESSVYCAPGYTGRGIGRRLYDILFTPASLPVRAREPSAGPDRRSRPSRCRPPPPGRSA